MGIYDTFYTTLSGTYTYLQSKDFYCTMDNFHLGDIIDPAQHGVSFFILTHNNELNITGDLNEALSHDFFSNRAILCILHNGRWIDYAIYENETEAKRMIPIWKKYFSNPAAISFAYQSLQQISLHKKVLLDVDITTLCNDFWMFDHRKEPRKRMFSFGFNWPKKKDITFKWLLEKGKTFRSQATKSACVSEFSAWLSGSCLNVNQNHPKNNNSYFYDGPEFPSQDPYLSFKSLSKNEQTVLLIDKMKSFDLKFFNILKNCNPDWVKDASPEFRMFAQKFLPRLLGSRILSFAWLSLRWAIDGRLPLFSREKTLRINSSKKVPLLTYLSFYLEVDEDFLIHLLPLHRDVFEIPAFRATIDTKYFKLQKLLGIDATNLANEQIHGVPYSHRLAIMSLSHSGDGRKASDVLQYIKNNGVNINNIKDSDGNTPFMYCLKKLGGLSVHQKKFFFSLFDNSIVDVDSYYACHLKFLDMFNDAKISEVNNAGENFLDIYPQELAKPINYNDVLDNHILTSSFLNKNNSTQRNKKSI